MLLIVSSLYGFNVMNKISKHVCPVFREGLETVKLYVPRYFERSTVFE